MVTGSQGNQRLLAELGYYAEQGAVTIATVANYVKCGGGLLLWLKLNPGEDGRIVLLSWSSMSGVSFEGHLTIVFYRNRSI